MPHINVNLDDVPDQFQPVDAGIYTCEIEDVEMKPGTRDPSKMKLVVIHKIIGGEAGEDTAHEMHGRILFDHIGLSGKPISLKRLCMAAGLQWSDDGFDSDDLKGKVITCSVIQKVESDPQTGEQKIFSNIKDYLVRAS
jgi:hypothetical protein